MPHTKEIEPNQLDRRLLGPVGVNPYDGHDSSPRKQMLSSHLGQRLVIRGATERRQQTGIERAYAKYTYSVKMPVDAKILKVINLYNRTYGAVSFNENPVTMIIFEDDKTGEVDYLEMPSYCSHHSYFGFEYKAKPLAATIKEGDRVAAGTILLDSPAVTDDGGYMYGAECNIALMTHPATSEDSVVIRRGAAGIFGFKKYEKRTVSYGSKYFPLNTYPRANGEYGAHPEIGDYIREDGILMALREHDEKLSIVQQDVQSLTEIDHVFDKRIYVDGKGGRIVDIRYDHDPTSQYGNTPQTMVTQSERYHSANREYHAAILAEYNRLRGRRGDSTGRNDGLQISKKFHALVVKAMGVVGDPNGARINYTYRAIPMDEWRVTFTIEYDQSAAIGMKITGCHGNKGILCKFMDDEDMPVDEDGNVADIIMDPTCMIARLIPGMGYELYDNAAARDVSKHIRRTLQLNEKDAGILVRLEQMSHTDPSRIQEAWRYLLGYYEIVSPRQHAMFADGNYRKRPIDHLAHVIKHGVYVFNPPENEIDRVEAIKKLEQHYRPLYGPVEFTGVTGIRRRTRTNVRIASSYIMLLEKTGDDWTAVSSGKTQHHQVLAPINNADKYAEPHRMQSIRAKGEAEARIDASYVGPVMLADVMERNNNPDNHETILLSIFDANHPTNIYQAIDRDKQPLGEHRPLQMVHHLNQCFGFEFYFQPHQYGLNELGHATSGRENRYQGDGEDISSELFDISDTEEEEVVAGGFLDDAGGVDAFDAVELLGEDE